MKLKNRSTKKGAAADFPQQKTLPHPYLQILVVLYLSSSPDLHILSSTWPSQFSPMTGFHLMWRLPAYSGGTVRELHTILYSPVELLPLPQALK